MAIRKLNKRITFGLIGIMSLLAFTFYMTPKAIRLLYPNGISNISPMAAQEIINSSEALVLDVREESEYAVSHLAGAKRFSPEIMNDIPYDTQILVYCTVGVRSGRLAEDLQRKGYSNVKNIDLGIINWKNQGLGVVDIADQSTEKVHVYKGIFGLWLKRGKAVK